MSQLATPSGIDHDYNFLHGIEHRVERSEKAIVEDRGLVAREELVYARTGERLHKGKRNQVAGAAQIEKALLSMGTVVHRAPKGMQRNRENETSWSRGSRCIHWQVEWMFDGGQGRVLAKAIGKNPIGEVYLAILGDQRRSKMTEEERRAERKRKADELKQRTSKKAKSNEPTEDLTPIPALQDPETGTWSFMPVPISDATLEEPPEPILSPSQNLYLLRPRTPSSFPKVLVPLNPSKSLDQQLKRRSILEFPTIYVLESGPQDLPGQFMLEDAFIAATGDKPVSVEPYGGRRLIEEMSTSGEEEADSSDSDDDEEMEEGEVV
jgi:hypothetical protein